MAAILLSIKERSEPESETEVDLGAIQAAVEKHQATVISNWLAGDFRRYEESCDDKSITEGVSSNSEDDDEQYTYIYSYRLISIFTCL